MIRYLIKILMVAMVASVTAILAQRIGGLGAAVGVALVSAVVCGSVGLLMRRAPVGRIGLIGRIAGITLPFGYSIGRGRLLPIVLTSWAVWTTVAVVTALCVSSGMSLHTFASTNDSTTAVWPVLLALFLTIDGIAALYVLKVTTTRLSFGSSASNGVLKILAVLLGMIGGSLFLWFHGHPQFAVALAGGPPLIVGGTYGLFLLFIIIARPRMN